MSAKPLGVKSVYSMFQKNEVGVKEGKVGDSNADNGTNDA